MGGRATFSHRAFRNNCIARPPSSEHLLEQLSCDPAGAALTLSRREMVALAGTMALASSAGINAAASALAPLDVTADGRSLRVMVAGRTFVLDTSRFGGAARLAVTRTASEVAVSLTSATYPGTDLPADFTLRFKPLEGSTSVHIRSAAFGFSATVPLLAWLEGRRQARARVTLNAVSSTVGDGHGLLLEGAAHAVLRPDFTLDLAGPNIATLTGPGVSIVGDEAHVWLASDRTPTSLTRTIKLRTFVQIRQKQSDWQIEGVTTPAGNTVAFSRGSFDTATIEAAQTRTGSKLAVVSFENSSASGSADFRFPEGQRFEGVTSLLPLENPRYGYVCGNGARFSVIANVANATSWLHLPGHSVLVGRHPEFERAELIGASGVAESVNVKTELIGVAVPLDGVIATPLMFPSSQSVVEGDGGSDVIAGTGALRTFSPEGAAAPPGYVADAGSISLTRPDDMLTIKLEFYNLILKLDSPGPRLERKSSVSPSYIAAELPPQSLLEQAYFGSTMSYLFGDWAPPVKSRIAGSTRLALKVPATILNQGGIPYTVEGLLDWHLYDNSVVPAASDSSVRAPLQGSHYPLTAPETRIEAPWGVFLSPSQTRERWKNRTTPFTTNGVTELWHTTLAGTVYADFPRQRPYLHKPGVRAVWARNYTTATNRADNPPTLFRNSFTTHSTTDPGGYLNRWSLVDLTARYQKARVGVNRLTLSPLGAWLDVKGTWPEYPSLKISVPGFLGWEHRATMGRDQFVRIETSGRIFPFGHPASLITITERKFRDVDGKRNAYLIQRQFIKIHNPERVYSATETGASGNTYRSFPYKRVRLKTLITPDLEEVVSNPVWTEYGGNRSYSYWPKVLSSGQDVLWEYELEDWDGRVSKARSKLIYMDYRYAVRNAEQTNLWPVDDEIVECHFAMTDVEIDLAGQKTAYSEPLPAGAEKDRRILETRSIRLGAWSNVSPSAPHPNGTINFFPKLHRANVRLEDVEAVMNADSGTLIKLSEVYLFNGYGAPNDRGHVFAEIVNDTGDAGSLALDIPADRTGGFASPNLSVRGLSGSQGAFGGDPGQFGRDEISTEDFFSNANPTLFGGITLLDILQGTLSLASGDVPNFNDYIVEHDGGTFARYEYTWRTTKFGASDIFKHQSNPLTSLDLYTQIEKSLTDVAAVPTSELKGTLTNFSLSFGCIEVIFNSFIFGVDTYGNVDVDPDIKDIQFRDELEFVNQLRQFLNYSSGGSGFAIDINGDGVSAIVTIALPDIAVGIFSLKNMAITAGLVIPFSGEPISFPFSFCTRDKPFELAVSGFGGGGYFLIELQASDEYPVKKIEFSLEFGICASVSLAGIASGSVEIKGGVLMIFEMGALTFTAFFRMAGRLDILGIIVVAVTFYLELTYMNKQAANGPTELMIGEATLTLEIEILFFSFSVTLTVTKQFEGDDPRFGDWMDADEWTTYCNAFGPATVGA